jgi:tetratricopeptide (TPR) repeat protein
MFTFFDVPISHILHNVLMMHLKTVEKCFSGEKLKTTKTENFYRTCTFQPHHRFRTSALLTIFVLFGMASQVLGANAGGQKLLRSYESGHIDIDKVFFVKNSVAEAKTPSLSPAGKPPKEKTAMDIFMDGVDALDMKNFEEAVRLFEKAAAIEPQNLQYQYYIGLTYARLKKNSEALNIFESLIEKDPKRFFKAYFDIAAIYSSEKKFQNAIETLKKAEKIDPTSGRVFLEMGYAYKNSGDYDQAIKCFSRAKKLDPQLKQVSTYMTGVTYFEDEKFDQAAQLFKETLELDPGTSLAKNARETIPRVEEAAWNRKPWYMITSFNWGYDDNVARDPLQEVSGGPVSGGSGKGDQFQTLFLRGGYKFLNLKHVEAGMGYTFYTLGYKDWTIGNVTYQGPHAYFQADWDPVYFRFQYDFSYFYSGGKEQGINPPIYLTFANNSYARLRMHTFNPTISILEPYNLRTDLNLFYQIKDYLDGINADSSRYAGDITQSYQIPGTQILPRIGYRTAYEQSGDDPATYSYHELMAGVAASVYWDIWADLSFAFMRTDFPDFSSTGGRRDSTYTTIFSLRRRFIDRLQVSLSYLHLKNDSDYVSPSGQDPYTFRKNVYMLEFTYIF